jgi:hypothetical protein
MSRIAPLLYDAIAHVVFFGIRMRLEKCNFAELLGDEHRDFRAAGHQTRRRCCDAARD